MSERTSTEAPAPGGDAAIAEVGDDFQTAFWSAKHALAHASAIAFAEHGVHEGQQFVLRCLWREDGLSPGEIARRLGLSTPTVTRAATRMAAAGLLRREPHPGDRRLVRLLLTDRGRKLEKVIDEQTRQLTERALATFSTAQREALVAALGQIRRNLAAG
jgi:MarR family transcriptional regulator, organic hydroperoxide resistance regulator